MKKFLIAYDLKKPGQNYAELYETIKGFKNWQHPLESVWVVKVGDLTTAKVIYETLRPKMDASDFLFIVDITGKDHYGWLSKSFWDWFKL